MTSSDRDPAARSEATGGSPTPPNDAPPADAQPRWLASSEGLVPAVPPATRQWQPEPDPEPDPVAAEPAPIPAPVPVPARAAAPADPRAYDPAAYAASGAVQARGTWSSPAVAEQPAPTRAPARPAAAAAGAYAVGPYGWPEERRRFPIGRLLFAFVLGLLLALFIAVGALYAYDQQYVGRILPGVRVGNLDLSGMPVAAARDRIAQEYAGISQGTVMVTLNGQTTEIPYSDFDRRVDAN